MHHQFLALPALWHRHLDLMAAFGRKRFGQQVAFLELVRDENTTRWRFVVVELRKKGRQDVSRTQRAVGLRKIGAVAPILSGAEEENLDAGIAAGLMRSEYVRL